jgi:hypothetical protein
LTSHPFRSTLCFAMDSLEARGRSAFSRFGPDVVCFSYGELPQENLADALLVEVVPVTNPRLVSGINPVVPPMELRVSHLEHYYSPKETKVRASFGASGRMVFISGAFNYIPDWLRYSTTFQAGETPFLLGDEKVHRRELDDLYMGTDPGSVNTIFGSWQKHPDTAKEILVASLFAIGAPENLHAMIAEEILKRVKRGLDKLQGPPREEKRIPHVKLYLYGEPDNTKGPRNTYANKADLDDPSR